MKMSNNCIKKEKIRNMNRLLHKALFLVALLAFAQGVEAQNLKIISFNIRYNSYNNIDGENGWPSRRDAVARMILEEKPAVIGLQEALIDQLQYLDSCLPGYRRVGVGRDDGKEAGEFMAIYYDSGRMEYLRYDTWWLGEHPEVPSLGWDAACRRTVTALHLRDRQSNREFVYLNTHLDHVGTTARAEGAKLIAAIRESQFPDHPIILGGDMNTTIEDTIFQAFYRVGLKPARELTPITCHKNTYTGFGKDKPTLIDHFFVSDITVESFCTLDGDYGVPYISDHYPIMMVIHL